MEPQPSDPSQICWLASLSLGESVWPWLPHAAVALVVLLFVISRWYSGQLKTFWRTYWPALRDFGILRVMLLVASLGYPGYLINSLDHESPILSNPFVQNYIAEMWAASVLIVVSYFFRHYIKRFVDRLFSPTSVQVRLPLMTATAPIILGLERHIWREHNIDLILDWRYAGRNALEDLVAGECHIAVAADYAVVKFLSQMRSENLAVLPFVVITNHLLIVRRSQKGQAEQSDIPDEPIAYYKNSVHEDFLETLGKNIGKCIEATSVLNGFWQILSDCGGVANGLLLWEPHYAAFQDMKGFDVVSSPTEYKWLLCVVGRYTDLERQPRLATGIYNALKRACDACNDSDDVVRACLKHFPEELLGINKEKLDGIVQRTPKHQFDIELSLTTLQEKLGAWTGANEWGAGALDRLLRERKTWPGLPPKVS